MSIEGAREFVNRWKSLGYGRDEGFFAQSLSHIEALLPVVEAAKKDARLKCLGEYEGRVNSCHHCDRNGLCKALREMEAKP